MCGYRWAQSKESHPYQKNVRTILCPNTRRQGVVCLPSWAYNSSAIFLATSVYDWFIVFVDFWAFISPTTLMSLQSSCFDLATFDRTRTRSGFRLAADPSKGMVALSATQVLGIYVNHEIGKIAEKIAHCFVLNSCAETKSMASKTLFRNFAISDSL